MARSTERGRLGRSGWTQQLRWHQRFPIRVAAFYGTVSMLLLAALSLWFTSLQIGTTFRGIQERLVSLVIELSIVADGVPTQGLEHDELEARWDEVGDTFERFLAANPRVESVYVMRITSTPAQLEFLVDRMKGEVESPETAPGEFLEPYDATDVPTLLMGLERPYVEDEIYADRWGPSLSAYAPIHDAQGHVAGLVGADINAEEIYELRRRLQVGVGLIFLAGLVGLVLITLTAERQLNEPLSHVIDACRAIAGGDLTARIQLDRDDEFGIVARSFDEMASGLQERERIRSAFGRFMSKRLAEVLLDADKLELGGSERDVTIVFTDLRGYSSIAEHADPVDVLLLLNEYLTEMLKIIDVHEGVVIEFLGDGILAVFGAPLDMPDHPVRAVRCAREMQARLADLNRAWTYAGRAELWTSRGIDAMVMRIGIHCGRVVAGNVGSEERMKYAVIGDNVNVAARLEQLNKQLGTTLLMSGDVVARLPAGEFPVVAKGDIEVKGRAQPVDVYSI